MSIVNYNKIHLYDINRVHFHTPNINYSQVYTEN